MALPDFPNPPTLGQQFPVNEVVYECTSIGTETTKPQWRILSNADRGLRGDLAAANSTVSIAGVAAGGIARKYGYFNFVGDFGAKSDGVTNDTAAVQAAHDALPSTGGAIIFPVGTTKITSLTLTKPVSLLGFGYQSVIDVSGTITSPTVSSAKLLVKDLKLDGSGNNVLLNINKIWSSVSSVDFELQNVWFNNKDGLGTLLRVYGARESGISNCWFTSGKTNYDSATVGIAFVGDDIGGAMNIDVSQCKFLFLDAAVTINGTSANYQFLAGIRVINNMMIGLLRGFDIAYADYIQIEQNMLDFVNKPVKANFVVNFKIRNNYFASRESFNDCIQINNTKAGAEMQWLEISKNRMFTYASTDRGNGILINANGGDVIYGDISDNDMDLFTNCIILQGSGGGRAINIQVKGNQARSAGAFVLLNSGAELNDIEMNFAEANVSLFIVDNNIPGQNKYNNANRYGTKRSSTKGKIIANGNGSQTTFSAPHGLFQTPSNGMASLGATGIASIPYSVSYNATDIIFEFATAPVSGTNNVIINWSAEV